MDLQDSSQDLFLSRRYIFKVILFSFIFIVLSGGISNAEKITGKVLDSKLNEPVSNMVIGIEELNLISETDKKGIFSFENIPKGKYTLYFSHKDYGTEKVLIKVKRDFYIEKSIKAEVYNTGDKIINYSKAL